MKIPLPSSQAARILAGLVAGLAIGALLARAGAATGPAAIADVIGGLWLDGLRMTIIPLVFLLIVTGIASAARSGGQSVTRRAVPLFIALLLASAIAGAFLGATLLDLATLPDLSELRGSLSDGPTPPVPPTAEWLRSLVPTNPVAAAANGAIVPLTLFALVFGFALSRLAPAPAKAFADILQASLDTILIIVGWLLRLAPIGVFALAIAVAGRFGLGIGTALLGYIGTQVAVTMFLAATMILTVRLAGIQLRKFVRAAAPAQAIAFSTQSSLASLPAMVSGCDRLGLDRSTTGAILPLAVAVFRIAAPASIVIVALTLGQLNGIELGPREMLSIVLLATLNTLVIAGLPNQITFFAAYAPPALAAGIPIELLPLMLAIDVVPDMFYTVSNVTADMAVATIAAGDRRATPENTRA